MNTQRPSLHRRALPDYFDDRKSVMPDSAIIDPQAIDNLRALNPGDNDSFLREITGIFLEDTPQRVAELEQSFESGDVAKFARAA